ncbi:MAG: iron-sulfur cluster assembly accessory protein [Cucumibacter sp.]
MDFKVISLTDRAAERIAAIIARADKPVAGVRVGVKNAGCAGMAYTLDYVAEPVKGDDHVSDKGVDVYVEPRATLFLIGTQMDFSEDKMRAGFVFNNPNQTGSCGCGESVSLKQADLKELAKARAEA